MNDEQSLPPEPITLRPPLPEPTPEAVEAGVFGICADGSYRPGRREILEIVAAQITELVQLSVEIDGYVRAEKSGCCPVTGRTTQSALQKDKNRRSAERRAHDARNRFQGYLEAYEGAFGAEASAELHKFVLATVTTLRKACKSPAQQLDLF